MVIIREQYLKKRDRKRSFPFRFKVPEGIGEIQIKFKYYPRTLKSYLKNYRLIRKALEEYRGEHEMKGPGIISLFKQTYPLRNLLTLSMYDAKGDFVGSAHRHYRGSCECITISRNYSSPGFVPCKIIPGFWTIQVQAHAVVTEECRYRLEISLIRKIEDVAGPSFIEKRPINSPGDRNIRAWYAGELHVHSRHSDGRNSLSEIIEAAKKEGMDFLALTDHNTVSGFTSIPNVENFVIIKGMEFTTYYGHALGLGLNSFIDWYHDDKMRNINDIIDEVHQQKALFVIAHPFAMGGPVCTGCTWRFPDVDYQKVDLMEVWSEYWD